MIQFKGALVALVTPFKNAAIDVDALERLIDFQLDEGTDGLVLCGTTGESPTLMASEKETIIRIAAERVDGKCPIVVGTGTNCTRSSVDASRQAADLGADGIMLVSPYYNKPTQRGLYEHFAAVASESDLPIIVYNIPGRCAVEISEEVICRLFKEFDNITTVKHATGSVAGAASLRAVSEIDILSGDDPITLPLMTVGALGVISVVANILPGKVKALTDAYLSGDYDGAQAAHEELFPLSSAMLSLETNPIPIKTAMAMKGMISEEFRLPLCTMEPANKSRLSQLMSDSRLW